MGHTVHLGSKLWSASRSGRFVPSEKDLPNTQEVEPVVHPLTRVLLLCAAGMEVKIHGFQTLALNLLIYSWFI
jgi:hypothetical protein